MDKYCCSGEFANPNTCHPSYYSTLFKKACPRAYSYAFDDGTSTFTCKAYEYDIVFCPNSNGYTPYIVSLIQLISFLFQFFSNLPYFQRRKRTIANILHYHTEREDQLLHLLLHQLDSLIGSIGRSLPHQIFYYPFPRQSFSWFSLLLSWHL